MAVITTKKINTFNPLFHCVLWLVIVLLIFCVKQDVFIKYTALDVSYPDPDYTSKRDIERFVTKHNIEQLILDGNSDGQQLKKAEKVIKEISNLKETNKALCIQFTDRSSYESYIHAQDISQTAPELSYINYGDRLYIFRPQESKVYPIFICGTSLLNLREGQQMLLDYQDIQRFWPSFLAFSSMFLFLMYKEQKRLKHI
jgi:uncharacterized protein YktA (UPF0223 family)